MNTNGKRLQTILILTLVVAWALAYPACRRHAAARNLPPELARACRVFKSASVGPEKEEAAWEIRELHQKWKHDHPLRFLSAWSFLDVLGCPDEGTESSGETFLHFRERNLFSFSYQVSPIDKETGFYRILQFICVLPDRVDIIDFVFEDVRTTERMVDDEWIKQSRVILEPGQL